MKTLIDIYLEEVKRKLDYIRLSNKVRDLKYHIKHTYATELKARYETYMLFEEIKWDLYDHINLFYHKEFNDFYEFEKKTYKLIDKIYG